MTDKLFTYERHDGQHGQYVVLSPDGCDLLGEWVCLAEAESIVARENLILTMLENTELLAISKQYCEDEEPVEWLDDMLHWASGVQLRALVRRSGYLHSFVAWNIRNEAKQAVALHKNKIVYYKLDKDAVRLRIANLLADDFTIANVDAVWADLIKYNDAGNLELMAGDDMFLSECITAIIMSSDLK